MITVYASNKILDNLFGASGISLPSTYYIGLSTTTISSTGTGATEPVGNAYARVGILNTKAYFSIATNGELSNLSSVTFPVATGSWGTVSHVFLSDALTVGNIWYFDALQATRIVQSGATLIFLANALKFKITNA